MLGIDNESTSEVILTIAIPTFDRCEQLIQLLKSLEPVFTTSGLEILILDNASKDRTREICLEIANSNPIVKYIRNEFNLGIEGNIIKALISPNSKYIWLLSDHMICYPEIITSTVIPILTKSDADLVYATISEYGNHELVTPAFIPVDILSTKEFCHLFFWMSNISAFMVKKTFLEQNIYFIYKFAIYTYPHLGLFTNLFLSNQNRFLILPTCTRFQNFTDSSSTLKKSYPKFKTTVIKLGESLKEMNIYNFQNQKKIMPSDIYKHVSLFRSSAWENLSMGLIRRNERILLSEIFDLLRLFGWRTIPLVLSALFMWISPFKFRPFIRHLSTFIYYGFQYGLKVAYKDTSKIYNKKL